MDFIQDTQLYTDFTQETQLHIDIKHVQPQTDVTDDMKIHTDFIQETTTYQFYSGDAITN